VAHPPAARALARRRHSVPGRVLCAAVVWAGLDVAASTTLFEPLPDISFDLYLALALAATLGAGLLAGRWTFVALAFVPLLVAPDGNASPNDLNAALPFVAAIAAALLLAVGVAISRVAPRRSATVLGALLLASPLPLAAWATARTIWPHDARPALPRRIDLAAGAFRGVFLGEPARAARRALPRSVEDSGLGPRPIDAPSAPLGIFYSPGDATSIRTPDLSLLTEHGHVVTLFITDSRAETVAGVGIGDNLGFARARLSGLVCQRSGEDVPTCGGRTAHATVLFVGDPIETITLSSIDTGWCFVRSTSCPSPRPPVPLRVRS
jgi:hypothetical protein